MFHFIFNSTNSHKSSTCLHCVFRFSNKGLVIYQAKIKSDIAFDSPLSSLDYEQISCIYSNIYEFQGFWNHVEEKQAPGKTYLKEYLSAKR